MSALKLCPSFGNIMGAPLRTSGANRRHLNAPPFLSGQHAALVAIQSHLQSDEKVLAFLDDICLVSSPPRVDKFMMLSRESCGVTRASGWAKRRSGSGIRPAHCDVLDQAATIAENDPSATAWRGGGSTNARGIRVGDAAWPPGFH